MCVRVCAVLQFKVNISLPVNTVHTLLHVCECVCVSVCEEFCFPSTQATTYKLFDLLNNTIVLEFPIDMDGHKQLLKYDHPI